MARANGSRRAAFNTHHTASVVEAMEMVWWRRFWT